MNPESAFVEHKHSPSFPRFLGCSHFLLQPVPRGKRTLPAAVEAFALQAVVLDVVDGLQQQDANSGLPHQQHDCLGPAAVVQAQHEGQGHPHPPRNPAAVAWTESGMDCRYHQQLLGGSCVKLE